MRSALFEQLQSRFFYGWVIVGISTTVMFASGPGQSHTFSVFIDLIARDLGLSNSAIASSYAFATLIAALGLSRMGGFVDRYGTRRVLLVVGICLGIACLAFGAVAGAISLSLGFMLLRFFGQGSMLLCANSLTAQWFHQRRGFAVSLTMLGFGASIAIHPTLAQWLIDWLGWRQAWVALGVSSWVMLLPLIWFFAHDKPEPLGLLPDGAAPGDPVPEEAGADVGLSLRQAMRLPAYWIVAAGLFTPAMLVTSLFFYQVSIFELQGLDRSLATGMFGVSALTMVLAMPAVGWLLDRFPTKYVFAGSLLLLSGSLFSITVIHDVMSAVLYATLFGINSAANMTFFGYMWARYFGRRHLGSIQGAGQTIGVIGASLGPLPLGIAFDLYGDYDGVLRLLAILPVLVAVMALFLAAPKLTSRA